MRAFVPATADGLGITRMTTRDRNGAQAPRIRSHGAIAVAMLLMLAPASEAMAQDADPRPPNASNEQVNPKVIPGLVKPDTAPGYSGPLATFAGPLAAKGITFHVLDLDFGQTNPSLGIAPGHGSNSNYTIVGVDADLGVLAGMQGTSLHFENVFFSGVKNLGLAGQIGDSQVGYQPPYTPRVARLSNATIEQKLVDGRLDITAGITHPGYFYGTPNCNSINSCFQDMFYFNAGWTSPLFAVPGANVSYQATHDIYVEAGAFAVQPGANVHVGYDFPDERYDGVIGMSEIGSKTDFDNDPYPHRVSLTGFFNTANHIDYNALTAAGAMPQTQSSTSGVVLQGQKIFWRKDGGSEKTSAPTALGVFASVGEALDSTIPIQSDIWVGTTLYSPFAGRPADRFNLKFNWQRLNPSYTQYLSTAYTIASGINNPYRRDAYVFEASAHLQLPLGCAFEPVFQYEINPNSYFNPTSAVKAKDGVYLGATLVVPVGIILGLQKGNPPS